MSFLVIVAGLITGLLLGMFGSGGSIVTIPILLYLVHLEPKSAIGTSLGIVAVTAAIAAVHHWRRGNVDLKVAAVFGLFAVSATYVGARIGVVTPVIVQLGLLALVMYGAAWKMLGSKKIAHKSAGSAAVTDGAWAGGNDLRYGRIVLHSLGVGLLTGVVGVGGGFLIVPVLVLLSGLPMKRAVGTTLTIVAVKSAAGFAGYAGAVPIDYGVLAAFTGVAVTGSFAGGAIAHRISAERLKRAFGVFLLLVATYILVRSVLLHLLH